MPKTPLSIHSILTIGCTNSKQGKNCQKLELCAPQIIYFATKLQLFCGKIELGCYSSVFSESTFQYPPLSEPTLFKSPNFFRR